MARVYEPYLKFLFDRIGDYPNRIFDKYVGISREYVEILMGLTPEGREAS
jgi:hypothetical protein